MSWTPTVLIDRLGGDEELARQMIALFVQESPAMLESVRRSVAGGRGEDIRRAAHAFKGSVANFIDGGPTATALALEHAGRAAKLSEVSGLLAQLEAEVAALVDDMREFERGMPCES